MVQQISGLQANVVGFEFTSDVTKEDYENVVLPAIQKLVAQYDELNVIFLIHTDIKNFTVGAWMQDAYVGLKNITKWRRMALISDSAFVHTTTPVLSALVPGEFKAYKESEKDAAIAWVSAPGAK